MSLQDPARTPNWVKSSRSGGNNNCVEVVDLTPHIVEIDYPIAIRDSKDPDGPALRFSRAEMKAFIEGVKAGEFDRYC